MNQQIYEQTKPPMGTQRSTGFSTASMILGVMAIMSCMIIYVALFFGCLSIVFALLSRQDSLNMPTVSKVGFTFSIIAILISTILTGSSIAFLINHFGLEKLLTDPAQILEDLVGLMEELTQNGGVSYDSLL